MTHLWFMWPSFIHIEKKFKLIFPHESTFTWVIFLWDIYTERIKNWRTITHFDDAYIVYIADTNTFQSVCVLVFTKEASFFLISNLLVQ